MTAPKLDAEVLAVIEALLEELAAIEHDQWIAWARHLMDNEQLTLTRQDRWRKLMVPYSQLSEDAKEQDRIWARKIIPVATRIALVVILVTLDTFDPQWPPCGG